MIVIFYIINVLNMLIIIMILLFMCYNLLLSMQFNLNRFVNEGYSGPHKILEKKECERLLDEKYLISKSLTWHKSIHEKSLKIIDIASKKLIIDKAKSILKKNIILWGSQFIDQKPGKKHDWHVDIEYLNWDGITVWIGLKNLSQKTPISLITHSHMIDRVPKELASKKKFDISDDKKILIEAKKLNPKCEIKTLFLEQGEFILWSGRVWHKTCNLDNKERSSIIFQYCSTKNKARIPLNFDYPNTKWSKDEPPCILICGKDKFKKNKIISINQITSLNNLFKNFISQVFYKFKKELVLIIKNFINKQN